MIGRTGIKGHNKKYVKIHYELKMEGNYGEPQSPTFTRRTIPRHRRIIPFTLHFLKTSGCTLVQSIVFSKSFCTSKSLTFLNFQKYLFFAAIICSAIHLNKLVTYFNHCFSLSLFAFNVFSECQIFQVVFVHCPRIFNCRFLILSISAFWTKQQGNSK